MEICPYAGIRLSDEHIWKIFPLILPKLFVHTIHRATDNTEARCAGFGQAVILTMGHNLL